MELAYSAAWRFRAARSDYHDRISYRDSALYRWRPAAERRAEKLKTNGNHRSRCVGDFDRAKLAGVPNLGIAVRTFERLNLWYGRLRGHEQHILTHSIPPSEHAMMAQRSMRRGGMDHDHYGII